MNSLRGQEEQAGVCPIIGPSVDSVPERAETFATPENLTSRMQNRKLLDAIVGSMDESLRTVFVLYEIEEMNLAEIASAAGERGGLQHARRAGSGRFVPRAQNWLK